MKILIVDDNEENLFLLENILRTSGYDTVSARNGVDALQKLQSTSFDLIVSDILMPKMDGFQLCRECKSSESLKKIPFIFYTANYTDQKDEEFALSLGAELFLIKPIENELFMIKIKKLISDIKEGRLKPPIEEIVNEPVFLKHYNERLIRKMEDKLIDLRSINKSLNIEIEERKKAEEINKRLEAQLLQSQKMEAVGQLAGGIAHDFNNILSAIMGYGELMQMKMNQDDPLKDNLKHILEAGEKAARLTHSLLAFSRNQVITLKANDINEIIRRVERLLNRLIGEDIELITTLSEGELNVMCDSGQIEQMLLNLATNARDAMPDGGCLIISSDIVSFDEEFIQAYGYGTPGKYVFISVADTGTGMDKETSGKIFEPFFTTKAVGKGTGLGLAMVYGIVKQHKGFINVYSELGKGTTFRIYLPLMETKVEEPQRAIIDYPKGGTETILVAEDDELLRRLERTMLEEYGYKVIIADSGDDAINKFAGLKNEISLCILDMVMPGKSGREAYSKIKEIKPGIKALFISGYTADTAINKSLSEERLDFMLKPLTSKELLTKVREILDKGRVD